MNEKCKKIIQKIKNNKEMKNAGWLIVGRVVQMIIAFFVSIMTARYLGPGNYGLINYAGAYVAFFSALCTLGINSVIVKDFVDNPDEQGMAIGSTIILRAMSSILSLIAIIGIVSIVDNGETITIIVASLCSVALIFQSFDTLNYWFQSRYESKITSIATLIAYFATTIYRILLLITGKNVIWFAFAISIDYICLGIVLICFFKLHNGPKLKFSFKKGKLLLSKSYHYIVSGMMVAIYGQTDKLMLRQMLGDEAVGYYSLASSINLMWVFVLTAIIDSFLPTIVRLHNVDRTLYEKKNRQLYAIVIYISIVVAICFIIFGKLFITKIYGDSYLGAVNPLRIIVWYTIFSYLGVARNAWIVCENKQKYLKYMYVAAVIINVFLNFSLIPILGASGAALASLLTQVFTSIIIPYFIRDMRPNVKMMIDAFLLHNIR